MPRCRNCGQQIKHARGGWQHHRDEPLGAVWCLPLSQLTRVSGRPGADYGEWRDTRDLPYLDKVARPAEPTHA